MFTIFFIYRISFEYLSFTSWKVWAAMLA